MKTGPNILGKGAIIIFCKNKLLEFSEYLCTLLLCGYFWGNEITHPICGDRPLINPVLFWSLSAVSST